MKIPAGLPMKILAFEFSSERRSVALANASGGSPTLLSEAHTDSRDVGALTLVERALTEAKLDRAEIDCLVVGTGPGSYTGIRAAIALAQGWQLARDVKLLAISSVDALVAQAQREKLFPRLNVVIDAQRSEFYLARYEISAGNVTVIEPLRLATLAEIQRHESAGEWIVGPDVKRWFPLGKVLFPEAATLATLASGRVDFLAGEKLEPIYLRETAFIKAPPSRVIPEL